jgi:F-type H+-transporting ATPase subunit delta
MASAARTYSKALLEAAGTDANRVADELESFVDLAHSAPVEWDQLVGPGIPATARKAAIDGLMAEARPMTRNLLKVLVDHGRLIDAVEIAAEFRRLVREREQQLEVAVTTPIELSDELRTKLERSLSESTGKQVNLHASVDPDIIGGLIVRYGDTLVDTSLRGRLESLRQQLSRPTARTKSSD